MCKRMTYAFKKNLKIAFGRRIAKIFSALIKFKEKKRLEAGETKRWIVNWACAIESMIAE